MAKKFAEPSIGNRQCAFHLAEPLLYRSGMGEILAKTNAEKVMAMTMPTKYPNRHFMLFQISISGYSELIKGFF